jgi:hypothetical protein
VTDLLLADVVTLHDGQICAPTGELLASVETRGHSRTMGVLRQIYRWTAYQKRGLRHLAHHFTLRAPDGELLFQVEKLHDRAFRRVLIWVYGPEGLAVGRVERIRNVPLARRFRLVANDGSVLGTLKKGITFDAVGLDVAGRTVARIGYGHHHERMVGEVSFAKAPEPYRVLVVGYAAVIYFTG